MDGGAIGRGGICNGRFERREDALVDRSGLLTLLRLPPGLGESGH